MLGMKGLTRTDERRYALGILNTALGGGTSSRLFQEVREHRGLAYSVYSFASHHADAGLVGVSVGCLPGKLDDVLATVRAELAKVAAEGITADELARGKGQLRGGLVLGLEDSGSRMSRLGKAELVYDEFLSIDDVIGRIDAVTLDEVRSVAAALFAQPEILAIVGQLRPRTRDRAGSAKPRAACRIGDSRLQESPPRRGLQATSAPPDDPDDGGGLLLDDRDPEAAAEQGLGGLLHDVRDELGPDGLVEEVDRATGDDALVEQRDLVVAAAHPEEVHVEGEHLVEALDRDAQGREVDLADDEAPGVDVLLVAALGPVDARLRAVDREQLAGLELAADELRASARSAPDFEHLVAGLDVHELHGPSDARRDRLNWHGHSLPLPGSPVRHRHSASTHRSRLSA